jgi:hypothetical protein
VWREERRVLVLARDAGNDNVDASGIVIGRRFIVATGLKCEGLQHLGCFDAHVLVCTCAGATQEASARSIAPLIQFARIIPLQMAVAETYFIRHRRLSWSRDIVANRVVC